MSGPETLYARKLLAGLYAGWRLAGKVGVSSRRLAEAGRKASELAEAEWGAEMEILEKGQSPEERTYTATCTGCKTRVRFKRGEANYESDQHDDYVWVKCPVCPRNITIAARMYDGARS